MSNNIKLVKQILSQSFKSITEMNNFLVNLDLNKLQSDKEFSKSLTSKSKFNAEYIKLICEANYSLTNPYDMPDLSISVNNDNLVDDLTQYDNGNNTETLDKITIHMADVRERINATPIDSKIKAVIFNVQGFFKGTISTYEKTLLQSLISDNPTYSALLKPIAKDEVVDIAKFKEIWKRIANINLITFFYTKMDGSLEEVTCLPVEVKQGILYAYKYGNLAEPRKYYLSSIGDHRKQMKNIKQVDSIIDILDAIKAKQMIHFKYPYRTKQGTFELGEVYLMPTTCYRNLLIGFVRNNAEHERRYTISKIHKMSGQIIS